MERLARYAGHKAPCNGARGVQPQRDTTLAKETSPVSLAARFARVSNDASQTTRAGSKHEATMAIVARNGCVFRTASVTLGETRARTVEGHSYSVPRLDSVSSRPVLPVNRALASLDRIAFLPAALFPAFIVRKAR
jgi:hypothetical protein